MHPGALQTAAATVPKHQQLVLQRQRLLCQGLLLGPPAQVHPAKPVDGWWGVSYLISLCVCPSSLSLSLSLSSSLYLSLSLSLSLSISVSLYLSVSHVPFVRPHPYTSTYNHIFALSFLYLHAAAFAPRKHILPFLTCHRQPGANNVSQCVLPRALAGFRRAVRRYVSFISLSFLSLSLSLLFSSFSLSYLPHPPSPFYFSLLS